MAPSESGTPSGASHPPSTLALALVSKRGGVGGPDTPTCWGPAALPPSSGLERGGELLRGGLATSHGCCDPPGGARLGATATRGAKAGASRDVAPSGVQSESSKRWHSSKNLCRREKMRAEARGRAPTTVRTHSQAVQNKRYTGRTAATNVAITLMVTMKIKPKAACPSTAATCIVPRAARRYNTQCVEVGQ